MKKIDLKREFKALYTASAKKVAFIDVPEVHFLMIDGKGDPNGPEFQQSVETLYSVAYTLKFTLKKGKRQIDYPVMPLEGLWWMAGKGIFDMKARDAWKWTAMIMTPSIITPALVDEAKDAVAKKKSLTPLSRLVLKPFREGLVAQTLHIGPYADEPTTIAKMEEAAHAAGYVFVGKHHEIYMSDPKRTAPERLKTILRHAVRNA